MRGRRVRRHGALGRTGGQPRRGGGSEVKKKGGLHIRTIYHNATAYVSAGAFAGAFAVEDGVFTAVGASEELLNDVKPDDRVVDLGGRFVCAGFNDSHMHLLNLGQTLGAVELSAHTTSLRDVLDTLRAAVQKAAPDREPLRWIYGRGWNQDYFTDVRRMPDRGDLDRISTQFPIVISRACGHCCVVNSAALSLCNIDENTPIPEGGDIGRADGRLDGRLYDNAMGLIFDRMPMPQAQDVRRMIRDGAAMLNRYGITSAQTDDYCVFSHLPYQIIDDAYRNLIAEDALTVRVTQQCNLGSLNAIQSFVADGNRTGNGDVMYRTGPLKLLGDGSLGSRTAHLSRPYADDAGTRGLSIFTPDEMNEMIGYAHRNGLQVAVHAIGDRCLDDVLDAVEHALTAQPRADHRHGIVHCQISRRDQLERMIRLKMHIYAQSIFLDYDNHIVLDRVGEELASTSYSWKSLMDGGLIVSNGSDCPVEWPDVMRGIECAVTRTSMDGTGPYLPDQAFSVGEALDSFTINGAYASFEERIKGYIRPGYLADFVVLAQNPFTVEPHALHAIPVLATVLGGKAVYGDIRSL